MAGRVLNRRDKVISDEAMIARIYDEAHFIPIKAAPEYYKASVTVDAGETATVTLSRVNKKKPGFGWYSVITAGGFKDTDPTLTCGNIDDNPLELQNAIYNRSSEISINDGLVTINGRQATGRASDGATIVTLTMITVNENEMELEISHDGANSVTLTDLDFIML